MEIDLELPSVQEDKLDTVSDANIGHATDVLCGGEEKVNFPTTINSVKGLGLKSGEIVNRSGEGMGEDSLGADTFGKGSKSYEPQKGLEFESKEEAYSFYREYARSVGFGITIKASRRSKKSGKFIDVKISCSRFGSKPDSCTAVNSRSCPKTDCKASMHMKRRQDGKWFIFGFVKEHNHEICPSDFYYALSGRGRRPGIVGCQKKGLQLALDEVDVQGMFEFFMLMQEENPNFFYAVDLDHEKRLRNVFWVDAKSRHDYGKFCDVVFFDSYYIRSKYRVPFMPVIGVNHHFQSMLLGCALIGEETMSTFAWLMRTWLRAVGGQTPKVIITDEGKSLEEAIVEVFPNARHCFCLWNVLRKVPENLGCVVNSLELFYRKLNKCIHRSWTQEEFEKKWWKMMDRFEVREDEWLQSLFVKRTMWVPAYMTGTFLAGLSTGERSECSSSSFDKYLQRETSCKNFVDQYKLFLHDRSEEEAKADYETHHKSPILRSLSPFEKQMATVYTRSIFKKFQVEVLGTSACRVLKAYENEAGVTYQVDDFEEQQSFFVAWNEENSHVSCLCRLFESRGFLCRHALILLQMYGVSSIPPRCVLQRWTNNANIRLSSSETSSMFSCRVQRFNDLCKRAIKLCEEGSLSQERYNIVINALQEAMEHCVGVNASVTSVSEPNMSATQVFMSTEEENRSDSLVKASKKKKIQKKRKVQSETEVITSLVQDCNLQMGMLDSGAHIVDNTYVPQQHMLGMGQIHPSSLIHNGYYSNQQGMQGMGQSDSIAMHIGHYGPHQSLQGLLQGPLAFRAPTLHGYFNIQDSFHDLEQSADSRKFHFVGSNRLPDKDLPW